MHWLAVDHLFRWEELGLGGQHHSGWVSCCAPCTRPQSQTLCLIHIRTTLWNPIGKLYHNCWSHWANLLL